jgi:hypothetical protein
MYDFRRVLPPCPHPVSTVMEVSVLREIHNTQSRKATTASEPLSLSRDTTKPCFHLYTKSHFGSNFASIEFHINCNPKRTLFLRHLVLLEPQRSWVGTSLQRISWTRDHMNAVGDCCGQTRSFISVNFS